MKNDPDLHPERPPTQEMLCVAEACGRMLELKTDYLEFMTCAYFKLTRLDPSEVVLVEDRSDPLRTLWYFEEKKDL